MTLDTTNGDNIEPINSMLDEPDPLVAVALPQYQYTILDGLIRPIVDDAESSVISDQEIIRLLYRPLIKYGQKCAREQRTQLNRFIDQLLMEARSQSSQRSVEASDIEIMFSQLANPQQATPGQGPDAPGSVSSSAVPVSPVQAPSLTGASSSGSTTPVNPTPTGGTVYQVSYSPVSGTGPTVNVQTMPQASPQASQGGQTQSVPGQQTTGQLGPATGPPGPSTAGASPSGGTAVQGGVTGPSCPVVVNVHVPPCPATSGGEAVVGRPGGEGVRPEFDEGKEPIVAAPKPEGGKREIEVKGFEDEREPPVEGGVPWIGEFIPSDEGICSTVERFTKSFSDIGIAVLNWVKDAANTIAAKFVVPYGGSYEWETATPLGNTHSRLVTVEGMQDIVDNVKRLLGPQFNVNASTLVGLWTVKGIIDAAKKIGISAFPSVIVLNIPYQLALPMPQLESVVDYLISFSLPNVVPSANDTTALYLRNQIDLEHAKCLWKLQGQDPVFGDMQVKASRQRLDPFTLAREQFRYATNRTETYKEFRDQGWLYGNEIDRYITQQEFIPPPTDIIHFTVREVFSTIDVGNAAVLAEWNDQVGIREAMRLSGVVPIDFAPEKPGPLRDLIAQHAKAVPTLSDKGEGKFGFDVPLAYWFAHYQHVSPSQVTEMLHRLRPSRVNRYPLTDEKGNVVFPEKVLIDDVRGLFRLNDYHPIWRDRLAAISYRPLGRIDTRRIYNTGGFGDAKGVQGFKQDAKGVPLPIGEAEIEITEQYKDQGYADVDAIRLAYFTATEYDKIDQGGRKKKIATLACKQFKAGIIDRDRYFRLVEKAGLDRKEAAIAVDNCEAELDYEQAIEAIKAVQTMFLRGDIDTTTASAFLSNIGVVPDRINRYLSLWSIKLKARRKEIPASQLCQWLSEGLITQGEVETRLINLGYQPTDVSRIIKHCQLGQMAKGSKAAEARARAAAKENKARYAHRTPAEMLKWFNAGYIHPTEVFDTLTFQGWTAKDAERWIKTNLKVNVDGSAIPGAEKKGP